MVLQNLVAAVLKKKIAASIYKHYSNQSLETLNCQSNLQFPDIDKSAPKIFRTSFELPECWQVKPFKLLNLDVQSLNIREYAFVPYLKHVCVHPASNWYCRSNIYFLEGECDELHYEIHVCDCERWLANIEGDRKSIRYTWKVWKILKEVQNWVDLRKVQICTCGTKTSTRSKEDSWDSHLKWNALCIWRRRKRSCPKVFTSLIVLRVVTSDSPQYKGFVA